MTWQVTHYTAIVAIACACALVTGLRIWQRRAAPGAIYLALQALAIAEWSGSLALESAAVGISAKLLWARVEYVGLGLAPLLMLAFAWAYHEQRNRLPIWPAALLAVPQAIVVLAAWTNEWHGQVWTSLTMAPDERNVLVYGHGSAFYVGVASSISMYLVAAGVLVHAAWRARNVYRNQTVSTIVCCAPSWIAGTIYAVAPSLVGNVEIAPIGFILTAILLNWTLLRHRLFDLVPVAHDVLIERMSDGLLVLDERDRIVSVNPAAQTMLWPDGKSRIGDAVGAALAAYPALATWLSAASEAPAELRLGGDAPRWIDARATELRARDGCAAGRLVVLRDVTDRVQAAEELRIREARYRGLYRAVPAGIIVRDATGAIVDANSRALAMLGVTAEQLAGTAPLDPGWQLRGENGDLLSGLAAVSATGQSGDGRVSEMALRVTLPGGETCWLLASAVSVAESDSETARGSIATLVDVTELKFQEQRLAYLAGHDELTGLPNFRTLEGALDRAVAAARRGRQSVLVYMDLNEFKVINDTLGHSTGDRALRHVVSLLRGKLRENDLLARVGGDEFVALLDDADLATGLEIAERLRQAVERCPFVSSDSETSGSGGSGVPSARSFPLGLSVGLAPVDGELTSAAVLVQADTAMYAAKVRGRDRAVVAGSAGETLLPAGLNGSQANRS